MTEWKDLLVVYSHVVLLCQEEALDAIARRFKCLFRHGNPRHYYSFFEAVDPRFLWRIDPVDRKQTWEHVFCDCISRHIQELNADVFF